MDRSERGRKGGLKGGRKGQPKIDKAEKARRLVEVEDMITVGKTRVSICAELSAKWGVSPQQVSLYWDSAQRAWAREVDPPKAVRRAVIKRKADLLYRHGVEQKKLSAAATALKMTAALDGIATDRVEHTGADGGPIQVAVQLDLSALSDEQLDQLEKIAETLAAARLAHRTSDVGK